MTSSVCEINSERHSIADVMLLRRLNLPFKVNEPVRWISSNTRKEGVVVAIVPPRSHPRNVGFNKLGDTSLPRDHESYIVKGGVPGQRQTAYWPLTSLLSAAKGLTADEVAWCHKNANRVRDLMGS